MAMGNKILVTSEPRGRFVEGKINGTPKPGTCMQIKNAAFSQGKPEYEVYAPGTDGDRQELLILLSGLDHMAAPPGRAATEAYVDGEWGVMYVPQPGDELNILFGNAGGTADDVAIGMLMICDTGTGKFLPTTGSPESEPFVSLEVITDPSADQLFHAQATGN